MDGDQEQKTLTVQKQIQVLTNLYSRLQTVRQIPHALLRPPIIDTLPSAPLNGNPLRQEFQEIAEIKENLKSQAVQDALRAARDSEKADNSNLNFNIRRENQRRRRPPSPDSPKPYISAEPKASSLFPPAEDEATALRIDGLTKFIVNFNESSTASKLHIWMRAQPGESPQLPSPIIMRFSTWDALTFFVTLSYNTEDYVLTVEGCTAFGPRERKSPHSFSEYNAFQNLSQQIAKMLQSHPHVSFQSLVSLLCSYKGLFVDRCVVCERVLSAEGHVPPVARLWVDAEKEEERGKWEPRHVTCLQS